MMRGLPNIFDYTDFRLFLSDWETYQRRTRPHFSYQWIQKAAGLGSRSHFLSVLQGRALSAKYLDNYIKLLQLDSKEEDHFRKLVDMDNCKDPEKRKALWNKLVRDSARLRPLRIESGNQLALFSNWLLFPLLSLLEIVPHERNPRKLAGFFLPELTDQQINDGLRTLQELGFVRFNMERNCWELTHKFIESTSAEAKLILKSWHRQWLHLGQWIHGNDSIDQNMSTLTIGISSESKKRILEILSNCRKEILDVVRTDTTPDKVYHLNFHLFQIATCGEDQ